MTEHNADIEYDGEKYEYTLMSMTYDDRDGMVFILSHIATDDEVLHIMRHDDRQDYTITLFEELPLNVVLSAIELARSRPYFSDFQKPLEGN